MKSVVPRGAFALATLLMLAPPAASALDLPGVFREVAGANPTLESRRARVEAARHRIGPAGAWAPPMLELGAMNVPTSGRFDQEPMTMKTVGLMQRVPVSGTNGLSRRSAGAAAAAEGAGLETTTYALFGMAWEAYADAWYAGALESLSLAHRDDMERLVRSARARYESGNGRLDDLLRAQAEQAQTLADLAAFQAGQEGARARLAALMGREAAATGESLAAPPEVALPRDADVLATVNDAHPRLRELSEQADHWRLAARAARRSLLPDLQLGVSYGAREPIMGRDQSDMWSAKVGLALPVFAAQRQLAEGAERDARARASEDDLRAASLDLEQQLRSTLALAHSARRTVTLMADTVVTVQRRAVAASWSAYDAGATDLWRVLEATHALYVQEVALVRARRQFARTEAKLLALTADGTIFGMSLPGLEGEKR